MNNGYTQWINQNARIGAMLSEGERGIFENYPRWQRNSIWPLHRQRRLLRTILAGRYIPPIVYFPSAEKDDPRLFCLDGRQRLSTLFRFVDGSLSLFAKGGFFKDLSDVEQAKFKGYNLGYVVLQETDEQVLRETYRDLQNLSMLSSAERLFSYVDDTPLTRIATEIIQHPYFSEQFIGDKLRLDDYQMGLYPLSVELKEGVSHMAVATLETFSKKNQTLPSDLLETIDDNLFAIQRLFKDVRTRAKTALIVMYQAAYFLRRSGYDLERCAENALTPWFQEVQKRSDDRGRGVLLHAYQNKFQRIFWRDELRVLGMQPGLVGPDDAAANLDRFASWLHNWQTCPHCKQFVHVDAVRAHAFRLTDHCTNDAPLSSSESSLILAAS